MPVNETAEAGRHIAAIGARIAAQVDLDRLLALSHTDVTLAAPATPWRNTEQPVRIAVARDAAFGFYYADDLEALTAAGAETIFFDTLRDSCLPPCDGLLIGGGFPECFLGELEANAALRTDIRRAIEGGLPTYAECGGLMYLARSIEWKGRSAAMVGAIPGDVRMHDKPVGRGYVILEPNADHPWRTTAAVSAAQDGDTALHAHEFHYSSLHDLPADTRYAYSVRRGHGIDGSHDGIVLHRLLASYTHLRATSRCDWPAKFVQQVRACRAKDHEEVAPCSH
jgi:cobyrinic acid a,c-diamide synthase